MKNNQFVDYNRKKYRTEIFFYPSRWLKPIDKRITNSLKKKCSAECKGCYNNTGKPVII